MRLVGDSREWVGLSGIDRPQGLGGSGQRAVSLVGVGVFPGARTGRSRRAWGRVLQGRAGGGLSRGGQRPCRLTLAVPARPRQLAAMAAL